MESPQARNQGEAFGAFAPLGIFKTLHSNFDICRNFQRIKMKFYILIILKKSYWNFSLSCSFANFVNDWYSTTNMLEVSTWKIV